MRKLTGDVIENIEFAPAKRLIELGYSPTKLIFDTTNTFTYIEKGEKIPRKTNSKQKRYDKNSIGVALLVTESNLPVQSKTYPANDHDAKVFIDVLKDVCDRLEKLNVELKDITLVFDKDINSDDNINKVVERMHVVGSLPKNQTKKYLECPIAEFEDLYVNSKGNLIKGKRFDDEELFGKKFTVVVTYDEALYKKQKETYEKNKEKILKKIKELQEKIKEKRKGRKLTQKGRICSILKGNDIYNANNN